MLEGKSGSDTQHETSLAAEEKSSSSSGTQSPSVGTDDSEATENDDRDGLEITSILRAFGFIAGQTTLVGALLFYFGWARTQAALAYFGIDSSIAQLSISDYILRSVDVTVKPLVILGILALIILHGHRRLASILRVRRDPKLARLIMMISTLAGSIFLILGLLGFYNWLIYSSKYPFVPVLLAIGVTLIAYGFRVSEIVKLGPRRRRWRFGSQGLIVLILDIALLFWTVSVYASVSGQQAAVTLAGNLDSQPSVVIYSENSLSLVASGVEVSQLLETGNQYHHRYSGLRLLLYSGGQYFLLPDGWKRGSDPVFLLRVNDSLRFEFYSG